MQCANGCVERVNKLEGSLLDRHPISQRTLPTSVTALHRLLSPCALYRCQDSSASQLILVKDVTVAFGILSAKSQIYTSYGIFGVISVIC